MVRKYLAALVIAGAVAFACGRAAPGEGPADGEETPSDPSGAAPDGTPPPSDTGGAQDTPAPDAGDPGAKEDRPDAGGGMKPDAGGRTKPDGGFQPFPDAGMGLTCAERMCGTNQKCCNSCAGAFCIPKSLACPNIACPP